MKLCRLPRLWARNDGVEFVIRGNSYICENSPFKNEQKNVRYTSSEDGA